MTITAIRQLIDRAPYDELVAFLAQLTDSVSESSITEIAEFLRHRDNHTHWKHVTPRLACRALLQKGVKGVEELVNLLPSAPGVIYAHSIVEALWYASKGQLSPDGFFPVVGINPATLPVQLRRALPATVPQVAKEALQDLVVEASSNADLFRSVFGFFFNQATTPLATSLEDEARVRSEVLGMLAESTIRLTKRIIRDLELLIEGGHREEAYQRFLSEHPVLIDPLASEVIPKQRLGIELITDFVLKRHDRRYILVEIERPQDRIFTESGDFTARFSHAIGQVLDFQQWVDSHKAYAERLLPNISSPRGLLIIGHRSHMSPRDAEKLHRFCVNSASIDVLTYDDVVTQSIHLYKSIHRQ